MPIDAGVDITKLDPEAIAPFVVFLASDEAAGINGRNFLVAGGQISLYSEPVAEKTIYKAGTWTLEELSAVMPGTRAADLVNPSPPQPPK